jgi:hypothetical protein
MSYFLRLTIMALLVLAPAGALAQHRTTTFIGFQTDCNGTPTPGDFFLGYKTVPSSLYAPCGLVSVNSSGLFSEQQLFSPAWPISSAPPGLEGNAALCGAPSLTGGLSFGDLELVFSPAVNELSFDALELANESGLTVTVRHDDGSTAPNVTPSVDAQERANFETSSQKPIAAVVLAYVPDGTDGWFVDSLRFNAWHCGDGEREAMAGEDCDDGNSVDCDGCSNDCKTTPNGCLTATGCVADGTSEPGSAGCNLCDVAQRTAGSDVGYTPRATGLACSEDIFCLVDEVCDGAGTCKGQTNDCDDALTCTVDSCDESANACNHVVGAGCLVDGTCRATGDRNPDAACEACDPELSNTGWSTLTMGETCGDPSCSEGNLTPAPTCSSDGACVAGEAESCMGFVCADSVSCVSECVEDDDCLEEFHCVGGFCQPDDGPGDECTSNAQCSTGFCADGVCCDRACDSTCEACNAEGSLGMCRDVPVGTDPDNECAGEGVCNGANECVSYETRGNGVCAVPQRPVQGRGAQELALLVCAAMLVITRRRTRARR